jgi:OmpA-OmpF porin, OOP family
LYYVLNKTNKENGLFVSNREIKGVLGAGEHCCDDIFSFQWLDAVKLEVNGILYDATDSSMTATKIPVKGAKVFLELKSTDDTTYFPVNGVFTDADGKYSLALMPNREYRLVTKKEGYLATVEEVNTFDKKKSGYITVDLGMKEAPLGAIGLQNIYYEYGKATLTESAKTSIDTTLLVIMKNNPELVIEISSHTDNIGSDAANQTLSQQRAESVVNYLIAKGIDPKMLNARGFGESQPIAANQLKDGTDNPTGRQLNRRTEFRIIGKMRPDGTIQEPGNF